MPVSLPPAKTMQLPVQNAIVTGASGFVGRVLMARLGSSASTLALGAPGWEQRLARANLEGATVFHLAARVHSGRGAPAAVYLHDNAEKTQRVALAAAQRGARAFVFLSSIKVNGEETRGRAFRAQDAPQPEDAYAVSKRVAEDRLREVADREGLAVTIVRAPLVYGRGARGNLATLLRLADGPWPLPFAAVHNRRSFVHVADLCELLALCAAPAARGRTYLAAHAEPASTTALFTFTRRALGRPPRLYAVRPALLECAAALLGQGERMRRLTRSLEADAEPAATELGWRARIDLEAAVADLAAGYRARA